MLLLLLPARATMRWLRCWCLVTAGTTTTTPSPALLLTAWSGGSLTHHTHSSGVVYGLSFCVGFTLLTSFL
jgi:hypothetical protein